MSETCALDGGFWVLWCGVVSLACVHLLVLIGHVINEANHVIVILTCGWLVFFAPTRHRKLITKNVPPFLETHYGVYIALWLADANHKIQTSSREPLLAWINTAIFHSIIMKDWYQEKFTPQWHSHLRSLWLNLRNILAHEFHTVLEQHVLLLFHALFW